jgi:hypothetical protein
MGEATAPPTHRPIELITRGSGHKLLERRGDTCSPDRGGDEVKFLRNQKILRAGLEGGGNLPALGCNIETMTHTRPTAYMDNFKLMMIIIIVALPLLLL